MQEFINYIQKISPIDKLAETELLRKLKTRLFGKKDLVMATGNKCRHLYFLRKGLVKICSRKDEKEYIMRFFAEHELLTIVDSFCRQTPSGYYIQAIEPTEIITISFTALEEMCSKHHCIETFYRKFISLASANMMDRINEMLEEDAAERYQRFFDRNRSLIHRLNLGDQAQYLGITPVSLSRIRGKK